MIEVEMSRVIASVEALRELRKLSITHAMSLRLALAIQEIEPTLQTYNSERSTLVRKSMLPIPGQVGTFKFGSQEAADQFALDEVTMGLVKQKFNFDPIPVNELFEAVVGPIPPGLLVDLSWMIKLN